METFKGDLPFHNELLRHGYKRKNLVLYMSQEDFRMFEQGGQGFFKYIGAPVWNVLTGGLQKEVTLD